MNVFESPFCFPIITQAGAGEGKNNRLFFDYATHSLIGSLFMSDIFQLGGGKEKKSMPTKKFPQISFFARNFLIARAVAAITICRR